MSIHKEEQRGDMAHAYSQRRTAKASTCAAAWRVRKGEQRLCEREVGGCGLHTESRVICANPNQNMSTKSDFANLILRVTDVLNGKPASVIRVYFNDGVDMDIDDTTSMPGSDAAPLFLTFLKRRRERGVIKPQSGQRRWLHRRYVPI